MSYKLKIVDLDKIPPAEDFLSPRELKTYEGFKVEKRRREWLGGRYALKKLASGFFIFDIKQIEVRNRASGQPSLGVPCGCNLPVSITHSGDFAAAAIATSGMGIGVDMEVIEPHSTAWMNQSFCPEELSSTAPVFLTELWAKKEAVLKFMGVGLSLDTKDIRFINGHLQFYGRALDLWAKLGSPNVHIDVKDLDGGYKLVVASEAPLL